MIRLLHINILTMSLYKGDAVASISKLCY